MRGAVERVAVDVVANNLQQMQHSRHCVFWSVNAAQLLRGCMSDMHGQTS
jgi:hypothetical protein